jgi:hypothetical protein
VERALVGGVARAVDEAERGGADEVEVAGRRFDVLTGAAAGGMRGGRGTDENQRRGGKE